MQMSYASNGKDIGGGEPPPIGETWGPDAMQGLNHERQDQSRKGSKKVAVLHWRLTPSR